MIASFGSSMAPEGALLEGSLLDEKIKEQDMSHSWRCATIFIQSVSLPPRQDIQIAEIENRRMSRIWRRITLVLHAFRSLPGTRERRKMTRKDSARPEVCHLVPSLLFRSLPDPQDKALISRNKIEFKQLPQGLADSEKKSPNRGKIGIQIRTKISRSRK